MEWECFWVNLREDRKVSESKMTMFESKMSEFKMSCHHQVESEWTSEVFFVQNSWIQDGRIQDGCHHQVESEWMSEVFFVQIVGINLGNCEWVWEEKQDGWIQDGRIQDGCHHQVESEWISQIFLCRCWELVFCEWIWEKITKVFESKMAVSESKMAEFKMAAIIKLSQNEWVKFFLCKMAEWQSSRFANNGCNQNQDGCHHVSQNELVWVRVRVEWECFWVNLRRR